MQRRVLARAGLAMAAALLLTPRPARAADADNDNDAEEVGPYPGTVSWHTDYGFRDLVGRLKRAIGENGLTLVATAGAEAHGGKPPANMVLLVTRADLAEEVVEADSLAGMELPIRLYVIEDEHRKASVIYRTPSSIFALYDNVRLDGLASDLDQVFAKTVDEAIGGG